MKNKFAGFLSDPKEFNNIGVVIVYDSIDRRNLVLRFSDIGCLSMGLDIDQDIIEALKFLYRSSEKLILIGFNESCDNAMEVAKTYEDLDGIFLFNSKNDSSKLKEKIASFANPSCVSKIFLKTNDYEKFDDKSFASKYKEEDLDRLTQMQDEIERNDLWDELYGIIQFI